MSAEEKRMLALNDDFVKLLSETTEKVFFEAFGIKIAAGKAEYTNTGFGTFDITGKMVIGQQAPEGTLAVRFPLKTITSIIEMIYQVKPPNMEKSAAQAAGEVCNMVYGCIKLKANETGFSFKSALPNVIVNMEQDPQEDILGYKVIVPFSSHLGSFAVSVALI